MNPTMDRLAVALAHRYRIERELGAGGMATVYLAEDLKHRRRVAVKVLKPELAAVLGAERFVQEIATTAALQHPHILPLFDSGEADGFLFYVMPFVDGETLRAKLDRETQMGVEEAVRIACDVADALHYAHSSGVIHRDIKPENILLANGRPMVADFGIALAVSAAAGGRMTETGLSLGTPHYMSPEQATAEKEIGARSDVYSLASVLYEMLAGQPPHLGGSAQQIIMKIITESVDPVTRYRKSVPPNVAAALAVALEKLPADRFLSAKAFADALNNPSFTSGGSGVQPRTPSALRQSGRRTRLILGSTTAVLALLVAWAVPARFHSPIDAGIPWLVDLGLPDEAGFQDGMALSADGSILLYGGIAPDRQIWLRRAGMLKPVPIPGTAGGCCPALSPDGSRVAFVRGGDVYVVPLTGGTTTLLGTGFGDSDDLAWTTDGHVIGASGDGGLLRVAQDGGPVERLTAPDSAAGEGMHWSPRALPDGRGVIFSIVPQDRGDTVGLRIGVVGPGGGAHSVLMPGRVAAWADPGHLLVIRDDGTLVAVPFDAARRRVTGVAVPVLSGLPTVGFATWLGYFVVARTGRLVYVAGADRPFDLVWADRTGAVAEVDSSVAGSWLEGARVSADGRRVVFASTVNDVSGIEIRDRQTGANSRLEVRAGRIQAPTFSADGRSVVFRLISAGERGVYRADVTHLSQRTPLLADEDAIFPSLSPDEGTLYFVRRGARGVEFVARSLVSAEPSRPAADATERILIPSFSAGTVPSVSPDGRWLAWVTSESGTDQLYVRSTDPDRTERWQVTRRAGVSVTAGSAVRWSADGRRLHFVARDSMMAAHVSGGDAFSVERLETLFPMQQYMRDFDVADGGFLFVQRRPGPSGYRLMMVDDWRTVARSR
jgi:eukaryotic-like serine/threonine-protein kinase